MGTNKYANGIRKQTMFISEMHIITCNQIAIQILSLLPFQNEKL